MTLAGWGGVVAVLLIGLVGYWLFIITEGTYLGQPIVTWMYDLVARRYDSIKGFESDIEAAYLGRPLAAQLTSTRASLVLDIGTGTGRLPLTLLDQPRFQGRIFGIDASVQMLHIAADKLRANRDRCWLAHQSAMQLPFVNASFDAVTMLEMLEFTPDPKVVLKEAVRVLRPGGLLLITRRTGFDAKLLPYKTYSEAALCTQLSNLGLENIHVQPWQVDYDLVWAQRSGHADVRYSHPLELFVCVRCGKATYDQSDGSLVCGSCGNRLRVVDGVIRVNS